MTEPRYLCSVPSCAAETSWLASELRQSLKGPICEECYQDAGAETRADGRPLAWRDLPPYIPDPVTTELAVQRAQAMEAAAEAPQRAPAETLLEVEGLTMHFPIYKGIIRRQVGVIKAVDRIDFDIRKGETLGLVGESGCGKSIFGRKILRLYDATAGRIMFGGQDIAQLRGEPLRRMRPRMQMIFQDPHASLNPRMTVGSIISEPMDEHRTATGKAKQERVRELLDAVGMNPRFANRYPHEFSGGQRQRIGIARAMALEPEFIVCDEPIAALDVSIQAQVVNLLEDLQDKLGLT